MGSAVLHGIDDGLMSTYSDIANHQDSGLANAFGKQDNGPMVEIGEYQRSMGHNYSDVVKMTKYDPSNGMICDLAVYRNGEELTSFRVYELGHAGGALALQLGQIEFDEDDPAGTKHLLLESVTGDTKRAFYMSNGPSGDPMSRVDFHVVPGQAFKGMLKGTGLKADKVSCLAVPSYTPEDVKDNSDLSNFERRRQLRDLEKIYGLNLQGMRVGVHPMIHRDYFRNPYLGVQPMAHARQPGQTQETRNRRAMLQMEAHEPTLDIRSGLPGPASRFIVPLNVPIGPGTLAKKPVPGHQIPYSHFDGTPRCLPVVDYAPFAGFRSVRPDAPKGTVMEMYLPYDLHASHAATQRGALDHGKKDALAHDFQIVRTYDLAATDGTTLNDLMYNHPEFSLHGFDKLTYVFAEVNRKTGFEKLLGSIMLEGSNQAFFTFTDRHGLVFRTKGGPHREDVVGFSVNPQMVHRKLLADVKGPGALFMDENDTNGDRNIELIGQIANQR